MSMIIRKVSAEDAAELLDIYRYYVTDTAITFEYEIPSEEEFRRRIEHTLLKYPYIAAADEEGRILGYAYASPFKGRRAYDWSVETSIYVRRELRQQGIGKALLLKLEEYLQAMNILNVNACIGYPEEEDEYLTFGSVRFHEKMGYRMVGEFHQCGYKFHRWYHMVWMEKMLGEHLSEQPEIIPFPEIKNT